jgi:hypothetical protein
MRLARSSVDAVPMGALPVAVCDEMNCTAKFPCPAASLLSPIRVARVSRLIGNFDTTAKPRGWQADFLPDELARIYLGTCAPLDRGPLWVIFLVIFLAQTHETPLEFEWRFLFPVSCFLFPVSCFLFPVSCFLFPVSCFLFPALVTGLPSYWPVVFHRAPHRLPRPVFPF